MTLGGNALLRRGEPYPLDVPDAETVGQIGYALEMQLDNFVDHQDTVAVITRVVVGQELEMLDGGAGTQVDAEGTGIEYGDRGRRP